MARPATRETSVCSLTGFQYIMLGLEAAAAAAANANAAGRQGGCGRANRRSVVHGTTYKRLSCNVAPARPGNVAPSDPMQRTPVATHELSRVLDFCGMA